MVNIEAIDLNLLLVLEAVYEERNVSRAARRLGLSQPALSNALTRLRAILEDPLFERTAKGMRPTPRTEQLGPAVAAALRQVRAALGQPSAFHPNESNRTFRIATTDHLEWRLLRNAVPTISREAPSVRLQIRRLESLFHAPETELRNGQLDLAVGFFPDSKGLSADTLSVDLFSDPQVLVARKSNPIWRRGATLANVAQAGHAAVIFRPEMHGLIDSEMAARGVRRQLSYASPHFLPVFHILAASDLLGCLPESLALAMAPTLNLRIGPLPFHLPPFVARLLWNQRFHDDPALAWLRAALCAGAMVR